jgi:hypothetical protein
VTKNAFRFAVVRTVQRQTEKPRVRFTMIDKLKEEHGLVEQGGLGADVELPRGLLQNFRLYPNESRLFCRRQIDSKIEATGDKY